MLQAVQGAAGRVPTIRRLSRWELCARYGTLQSARAASGEGLDGDGNGDGGDKKDGKKDGEEDGVGKPKEVSDDYEEHDDSAVEESKRSVWIGCGFRQKNRFFY